MTTTTRQINTIRTQGAGPNPMLVTRTNDANPSPMTTPHPKFEEPFEDPMQGGQPVPEGEFGNALLPEQPEPILPPITSESGKREENTTSAPLKMATFDSKYDASMRVIENSIVQAAKKYDPNVFTIVNQKTAMKKRVTSDLDLVVYIDGARFLPDNVNITKLKVSFYNRDGKVIGNEIEHTKMMTETSDVYSPTYELKIRLSKDEYELSEGVWMISSLYTLEISQQHDYTTSVFFAYNILPLAITEKEGKDPFVWGFSRLVLNHGAFQLPLYSPRQTRETMEETILAIE